jgi:hypothetical protein
MFATASDAQTYPFQVPQSPRVVFRLAWLVNGSLPVPVWQCDDGRGWGLKAKNHISAGQFVLEYVGEVSVFFALCEIASKVATTIGVQVIDEAMREERSQAQSAANDVHMYVAEGCFRPFSRRGSLHLWLCSCLCVLAAT